MSWLRRNRIRLLAFGLLLFSFFILSASVKSPRNLNWLDRILLSMTAPLQYAIVSVVDGTATLWNNYVYLADARQENLLLRTKAAELERRLAVAAALKLENNRLRDLVHLKQEAGTRKIITGKIFAVDTSPLKRSFRINVGKDDGVMIGDPVVAGAGLVGRISDAVSGYAEVQFIVDGGSAIEGIVQRSRAKGIIRGQGRDNICRMDNVVRTADVEIGDRVVTAGSGNDLPPGLLIGTIAEVSSPVAGIFRSVDLKPAISFESLEEVVVMVRDVDQPTETGFP